MLRKTKMNSQAEIDLRSQILGIAEQLSINLQKKLKFC